MFSYFGDVIKNSGWIGAILIFTPDCGYVYLSVLQDVCEVKIRKFKMLEVLPLLLKHNRGTSVTLTGVSREIHKGSDVKTDSGSLSVTPCGNCMELGTGVLCLVDTHY